MGSVLNLLETAANYDLLSKMSIDLYHMDASAPCRSVRLTAKMVGVELNLKVINLPAGEHLKPEFIKINPQHNIPTIVDDDFALNESRAICGYLDQRLYFDMGVFYQIFGKVYYPVMFGGATQFDETAKNDFANAVGFLDTFLSQNKYAAGDHLTIADICLMASAATFEATDAHVFDKYPTIKNWMEACKSELVDYQETNQVGAEVFGKMAESAMAKMG